jgi:hypothetical protein
MFPNSTLLFTISLFKNEGHLLIQKSSGVSHFSFAFGGCDLHMHVHHFVAQKSNATS